MAARKDWADSQETTFLAQITVEMTASQCWPSHCDAASYSWRKEEGREKEKAWEAEWEKQTQIKGNLKALSAKQWGQTR